MQTALAIIAHALRMLIFETTTTLRVILPALIMVIGSAVVAIVMVPEAIDAIQSAPETVVVPAPSGVFLLLILGVIGLLGYALMAILWHRHVLMNGAERPEALFPNMSIFLRYVGRAIVVGFMQMLASIPIALAMGLVGIYLIPAAGGLAILLIGLLGGVAFVWVALRVSLVLPAGALGHYMSVGESWNATAPLSKVIWGVSILLAGLNMFVFTLADAVIPTLHGISLIAYTVVYLLEGLVFVSVLTTLYGNLVEGRSLG